MTLTTPTTIPLIQGQNYISFPASSVYNFRTIFTDSGIINDIGTDAFQNKMFYRYDPILNNYILVDLDLGHIEQGKGYYLYVTSLSPGAIVYDNVIEYVVTFDQFKSRIVKGWNLLGVGKDSIVPQTWCKILDPTTMTPVTILETKRSYLVNYDECIQPDVPSVGSSSFAAIAAIGTILFAYYMLTKLGIVGKRVD